MLLSGGHSPLCPFFFILCQKKSKIKDLTKIFIIFSFAYIDVSRGGIQMILKDFMLQKHLLLTVVFLAIPTYIGGCSFYRQFYKPLTPQEELVADIWPILNSVQKKEINKLQSIEEVQLYIDEFWDDRDPTPETEVNEFEIEYQKRLDYVHIHYRYRRGWTHSDRGRVYLIYGPPDDIHYMPWVVSKYVRGPQVNALEIWVYEEYVATPLLPTIFDNFDPNLMKFVFADYSALGQYTQIYSNVAGEKIDPDVYCSSSQDKFDFIQEQYLVR